MIVTSDELKDAVADIFENYTDEINDEIHKIAKDLSEECVVKIKTKTPKRTGRYIKGWAIKDSSGKNYTKYTIHNKVYQLTHLLEFGHVGKNKYGKWGIVNARPHIKPAEDYAIKEFPRRIEEAIKKTK